ncbi:MAG: hypothetical protein ACLSUW_08870 [Akkermansia sp.]
MAGVLFLCIAVAYGCLKLYDEPVRMAFKRVLKRLSGTRGVSGTNICLAPVGPADTDGGLHGKLPTPPKLCATCSLFVASHSFADAGCHHPEHGHSHHCPQLQQLSAAAPLVTAYMLTVCVLMPASGWISDKLGHAVLSRWLSLFFQAPCCAPFRFRYHDDGRRVIQGISGAFLMPVGRLVILRPIPAPCSSMSQTL